MKQDLKRRLAKLEAQLGADQIKLRRLAVKLNIDPDRMLSVIEGREKELAGHLVGDGITWEGFLLLRRCLGGNTNPGVASDEVGSPSESGRA